MTDHSGGVKLSIYKTDLAPQHKAVSTCGRRVLNRADEKKKNIVPELEYFPLIWWCRSSDFLVQHVMTTGHIGEAWNQSWLVISWQMMLSSSGWTVRCSWTKSQTLHCQSMSYDIWTTMMHHVKQHGMQRQDETRPKNPTFSPEPHFEY